MQIIMKIAASLLLVAGIFWALLPCAFGVHNFVRTHHQYLGWRARIPKGVPSQLTAQFFQCQSDYCLTLCFTKNITSGRTTRIHPNAEGMAMR